MTNEMKKVVIYTDGSCSGNPGPGGWGTILTYIKPDSDIYEKEISGGDADTTNNRMELTAVIEGLKALKQICDVTVVTDSAYVANAFNKDWITKWQTNNFKNGSVKNIDLWQELIALTQKHTVTFEWVKGHTGHPYNERCDKLATEETKKHTQA